MKLFDELDISSSIPDGLVHVDKPRLGPTCRRLGIEYAKAIVGWNEFRRQGRWNRHPYTSGVVVHLADHARLLAAIDAKKVKESKTVATLPVLAALFTLNRRAKRCRDLAQVYYQRSMHGLAGSMKHEKELIYDLKGQVLHYHVEAGILIGGKYHRFPFGNWAEVLEGEGYRFHRPCPPQPDSPDAVLIESVEAKPKGAKEPSLGVACQVVLAFLKGKERVRVYEWPRISRRSRWVDDEDDWDNEDESDHGEWCE